MGLVAVDGLLSGLMTWLVPPGWMLSFQPDRRRRHAPR